MPPNPAKKTLSGLERLSALKHLLLLNSVALALRWFGLSTVQGYIFKQIRTVPKSQLDPSLTLRQALELGAYIGFVNHRFHWLKVSCLPESLTVWWLLGRQGIASHLRIGVRKVDQRLDGHAWIEVEGQVVSGDPNLAGEYLPMHWVENS
jgi:hypothetical protein